MHASPGMVCALNNRRLRTSLFRTESSKQGSKQNSVAYRRQRCAITTRSTTEHHCIQHPARRLASLIGNLWASYINPTQRSKHLPGTLRAAQSPCAEPFSNHRERDMNRPRKQSVVCAPQLKLWRIFARHSGSGVRRRDLLDSSAAVRMHLQHAQLAHDRRRQH